MKLKLKTTLMKTLIKLVLVLLLFYALIQMIGCSQKTVSANPRNYSVADRYKNY